MTCPRELAEAAGDVPWVRWGAGFHVTAAWWDADSGALALQRTRPPYGTTLATLGEPAASVDLALRVVETAAALRPVRSVTLPRAAVPPPGPVFGSRPVGESWEWMWTDTEPPAVPGEDRVVELDARSPGVRYELAAFLAANSPRHSAEPDDEHAHAWLGVRAPDGDLLACLALYQVVPGVDLMASVAVAEAARGQGLGLAIATAGTRRMLREGSPVATVDLYSDNTAARALYRRLGYRLDQAFISYPVRAA
jgi:ribosomal protein S18 acetylase RimI-like enzyme